MFLTSSAFDIDADRPNETPSNPSEVVYKPDPVEPDPVEPDSDPVQYTAPALHGGHLALVVGVLSYILYVCSAAASDYRKRRSFQAYWKRSRS